LLRVAFTAGGVPQAVPAAGLVSSALVEVRIDNRFGQRHWMTPVLLPILGEPPEHQLHKTADQIGALTGRKHHQARVIDHQRQARAPLLLRPADEVVAGLDVECGGVPTGQSQPLPAIFGHITKVLPDQLSALQVMMLNKQLVESFDLVGGYGPDRQMDQNLLFIGSGLTKTCRFFFHARQLGKMQPGCPGKRIQLLLPQPFTCTQKRALAGESVLTFFCSSAHVAFAPSICLRLAIQALRWLIWRAFTKLGIAIAASKAMMATTIMIS